MRFILFPLALPSLGYHPHISLDFTGWGDSEGPHGPQVSAHLLTLETSPAHLHSQGPGRGRGGQSSVPTLFLTELELNNAHLNQLVKFKGL